MYTASAPNITAVLSTRAGRENQIALLEGDAADILPELTGSFDMIFMDAAKGQYIRFLPDSLRLLAPG